MGTQKSFMPDGLFDDLSGGDVGELDKMVKKYDASEVIRAQNQVGDANKGWAVNQSSKPFRMADPQDSVVLDGSDGTPEWAPAYGKKPAFARK